MDKDALFNMRFNQIRLFAVLILGVTIGSIFASDESDSSGIQARIHGKGRFYFGQIVDGQYSKIYDGAA